MFLLQKINLSAQTAQDAWVVKHKMISFLFLFLSYPTMHYDHSILVMVVPCFIRLYPCSCMCIIPTRVSPHAALLRKTVWVESRVSWFLLTVLYTQWTTDCLHCDAQMLTSPVWGFKSVLWWRVACCIYVWALAVPSDQGSAWTLSLPLRLG